jgi:hypothetical protein
MNDTRSAICLPHVDGTTVTSDSVETRTDERARAAQMVAAWMAGTATPPPDDLSIQPLRADGESELCFCVGTFCWPGSGELPSRNASE